MRALRQGRYTGTIASIAKSHMKYRGLNSKCTRSLQVYHVTKSHLLLVQGGWALLLRHGLISFLHSYDFVFHFPTECVLGTRELIIYVIHAILHPTFVRLFLVISHSMVFFRDPTIHKRMKVE
jgi:hypothetical protein